jgi:hypothetical protein
MQFQQQRQWPLHASWWESLFLTNHRYITDEDRVCGPVHLIACQKSTTEKQATDLLGFPDATVVTTTFGVYLVDPIQ